MSDLIDLFKFAIAPFALLLILIFSMFNWYTSWQCSNFEQVTGRETQYIHFDACYVKQDDEWVRYDNKFKH